MNKNMFSNHVLVLLSPRYRVVMMRKDIICGKEKKGVRRYFCGKTVTDITITTSKNRPLRFDLMAKSVMVKGMVLKIVLTYF